MDSDSSTSNDTPIIILVPCESDSIEENDNISNKSQESISSSDLIDDSDIEAETIVEIKKISYYNQKEK